MLFSVGMMELVQLLNKIIYIDVITNIMSFLMLHVDVWTLHSLNDIFIKNRDKYIKFAG